MKMRAGAAYKVAEAKLQQALIDLGLLLRPDEQDKLAVLQERWNAYREALADFARRQFDGGSHAPLAAAITAMAETERRMNEVQAEIEGRTRR